MMDRLSIYLFAQLLTKNFEIIYPGTNSSVKIFNSRKLVFTRSSRQVQVTLAKNFFDETEKNCKHRTTTLKGSIKHLFLIGF